jgi:hypothetical protein
MEGEILAPQDLLMLKPLGSCQGPNGVYKLFVDQHGQPVVLSELTKRKFKLTWPGIVELAVDNGIDDGVVTDDKDSPGFKSTYTIECESGRYTSN